MISTGLVTEMYSIRPPSGDFDLCLSCPSTRFSHIALCRPPNLQCWGDALSGHLGVLLRGELASFHKIFNVEQIVCLIHPQREREREREREKERERVEYTNTANLYSAPSLQTQRTMFFW